MNQMNFRSHFFSYIKILFLLVVMITNILRSEVDEATVIKYLITSSLFFLCASMVELLEQSKKQYVIIEIVVLVLMYFVGVSEFIFFAPIAFLDFIVTYHVPSITYLLCILLGMRVMDWELSFYLIECLCTAIIYYQEYSIVAEYRKDIMENNQQESKLKRDIESTKRIYEQRMKESRLRYENQRLKEKAEISQALHDKLGHSINGSLYQLEACKLILEQQPEKSKTILQAVIDTLRSSMDEIRIILRHEKPSMQQMALVQLHTLCEECIEKYDIKMSLAIKGDETVISDTIWEVIVDNTYEAVSNSLKYAQCSKIDVQILILHEVIRCTIQDNGVGCNHLMDGMGLQGMKQRIRRVKGYINIEASNGFQINMIIPRKQIGDIDGTDTNINC